MANKTEINKQLKENSEKLLKELQEEVDNLKARLDVLENRADDHDSIDHTTLDRFD